VDARLAGEPRTGRPTNLQPSPSKTQGIGLGLGHGSEAAGTGSGAGLGLGGSASKQGLHGGAPPSATHTTQPRTTGGDDDEFDIEALLAVTHR
jgi:hypothetical protein